MVELIIAMVIVGILFALGMPSFREWLTNSQIRAAADAIQDGLQMARAEAVRRNTLVRFQLTSTADSSCALSTTGTNWVVSLDDASAKCDVAASETTSPRTIQKRAAAEGSSGTVVSAGQATVIFNGLGRVTPTPAAAINVCVGSAGANSASCADTSGAERRLLVVVSSGGQIRLCDPRLSSADAQGC